MSDGVTSTRTDLGSRQLGVWRHAPVPSRLQRASAVLAVGFCLGLFAAAPARATATTEPRLNVAIEVITRASTQPAIVPRPMRADFHGEPASNDARTMADWAVDMGDNRGSPFVIVDKKNTKVFVFDGRGHLLGATPALLGLARGDDSAPGIGDRELSRIRPEERTTPAGRFVASLGRSLGPQDVLWVDYAAAISLHRVLAANTREHRLERLAAASPLSHRITFGCINVPAKFYDGVVHPAFTGTNGIVYILPEIKSIPEVFFNSAS